MKRKKLTQKGWAIANPLKRLGYYKPTKKEHICIYVNLKSHKISDKNDKYKKLSHVETAVGEWAF